jgi:hypothetical protein
VAKEIKCVITITETSDGKLAIFATVPDGAEKTIAGMLTEKLVHGANSLMNETLGQHQKVETSLSN